MQIALTKKLADALALKLPSSSEEGNPLFSWTANWTNVWSNRKAEDMLVLVNNATRFTVAIYEVKRKDLKRVDDMMLNAIRHSLLAMNLNPEMVEEYLRLAGKVDFTRNNNRQTSSWVSRAGLECAMYVGNKFNDVAKMLDDTVGVPINYSIVNASNHESEAYYPYEKMIQALTELTGKQPYRYRAFELRVTLDLDIYKAERMIIVPAQISLTNLHKVLQSVYDWKGHHLYDFTVIDRKENKPLVRLVSFEEELDYDKQAKLLEGHTLSEFLSEHTKVIYTYDYGDCWEHEIQLVREIEEYDKESPYLLEVVGQSPPEDVGGVGGFINFREIMLDRTHPEHHDMMEWAGYWTVELDDWEREPKVIRIR